MKSQIAMEYILIVAISLILLIPAAYLFRSYAYQSSDRILESRLTDVSNQILSKAAKIYYYGPPSKSIVTVEMPDQINKMYMHAVSEDEFYLVYNVSTTSGNIIFEYISDIPLFNDSAPSCEHEDARCNKGVCWCFPERVISNGIKHFKVEAVQECDNNEFITDNCITIEEISPLINPP